MHIDSNTCMQTSSHVVDSIERHNGVKNDRKLKALFLPVRRLHSAVFAMATCPSVRLSVCDTRYCV